MAERIHPPTVGSLPETESSPPSRLPAVLTRLVWLLWLGSLGVLAARALGRGPWSFAGVVAVDGLTVLLWTGATFLGGIVHSYARRYMAGNGAIDRFFVRMFGFTLTVLVLVAADHAALFLLAWLSMGLVMADLIGHVRDWAQARAAARLARRAFLTSTGLVGVAVGTLWWATGETTVSGLAGAAGTVGRPVLLVAVGALVLAAMVQSALVPFHTWLLASMTTPTPASALMHAGFVNAGGILLVRFAPVVTVEPAVMLLVVVAGATSALAGKLLKSVQPDIKRQLGCSTVGQMGFMIMQAGLGFFAAAVTHLLVHGCYKAYQFLSSGGRVAHTSPSDTENTRTPGISGTAVTLGTGVAGGALFAGLTGKGTTLDGGVILTLLIVLITLHATWTVVGRQSLPASVRYVAVPVVGLVSVAGYAAVYTAVTGVLSGLPVVTAPTELTAVHVAVAAAFVVAYVGVETGLYRHSHRLYVWLVNLGQPPTATVLTDREGYDEH